MTKEKSTVEFEQVIERGCGIDVHKEILVATLRGKGLKEETHEFSTFTESIEQMRELLKSKKVTHVAMESTGVYWKPVFNILEEDFEILLVNAAHLKSIPGDKTDKKDSRRITKLLLAGLLKGSFTPSREIRELRDVTRYKRKVVQQIASEKNRVHKLLEDANIKLSSVVSNLSGATATKIIDAIIEGQEDVNELVKLRHGKMKATIKDLASALTGKLTGHHRFMLQMVKTSIRDKEALVAELDKQIDKLLEENQMTLDVELLSTVPGVDKNSAATILAEIGNDMSQFPSEGHLASWAGISPGNNESAGKKKVEKLHTGIVG